MNSITLCQLARTYSEYRGVSLATTSNLACGHARLFIRINTGAGCTISTYNKVLQYFSDHWPLDLPWPLDIPRPDPAPDSPAVQAMIEVQNRNKPKPESENSPLLKLNAKGHIADPEAFCTAISFGCAVQRSSFDQVIHQYADGRPRSMRTPRNGSISADILRQLVAAGDTRFTARIELINKYGGGA